MRFGITDEIAFPLEVVYEAHRDRMVEIVPMLASVSRLEVLERSVDGDVVTYTARWFGGAEIPGVLRGWVRPEMLTWIDRAVWDARSWTTRWTHTYDFAPRAVSASGINRFEPDGDVTLVHMSGAFSVDPARLGPVPEPLARRLAPALEKWVVGFVQPGLRQTNRAVERWIEENG